MSAPFPLRPSLSSGRHFPPVFLAAFLGLVAACGSETAATTAPGADGKAAEPSGGEGGGGDGSIDLGFPPVTGREPGVSDRSPGNTEVAAKASTAAPGAVAEKSQGRLAPTAGPQTTGPQTTGSGARVDPRVSIEALRATVETLVGNAVQTAAKLSKNKAHGGNCLVAVMAIDVDSGQVLVRRQHDVPMIPASNLKLLTSAAALGALGPAGAFTTPFEAVGEISGGVLEGDLVVRGSGDPLYRREGDGGLGRWLRPLAADLEKAGIERVTGALVLDEGTWLVPGPAPQWPAASDHWQMYCALAGAFTANGGSFRATVTPKPASGSVDVVVRPRHTGLERRGSVKLGRRNAVNVGANRNGLTVKGTIPGTSEVLVAEFSAPDPVDLFGHGVVGGLADLGVAVDGGFVRTRNFPGTGPVVHTIKTPVTDLLAPILEDSHNALADQLFLALGAQMEGAGTRAAASKAVKSALRKIGVVTDQLVQVDGSGLSKANRTSAVQLVALVASLCKTGGPTAQVFIDALPIAGRTGSLKGRMRGTPAEGRVWAKTGWVQGASALSGMVKTLEGRSVVFSILVGYPRVSGLNTKAWKPMQDEICAALVSWTHDGER